jgi:VWFA-related protein
MTTSSLALVAVAVAVSAAAALAAGQQPQTPAPPVFRSGAQYVTVDVVVTDRHDKPVTMLTREDFEISERGVAQKIADFTLISIPPASRAIDVDAPTGPPMDVASNARSPQASRAIAIVIDDTSIRPQDLIPLKRVLVEFLRTLGPDDQVALTWTSRSDISQDFTNDVGRLIDAVNNRRAAIGLGDLSKGRNRVWTLRYVVSALESAHQTRRAIFFVTGNACKPIPLTIVGMECVDLVNRAKRAGVPIYTLDPRLVTDPEFVAGIGNVNTPEERTALVAEQSEAEESMKTLASATGGRGFAGISNPVGAVGEIMAENGSYYLLGYYPDPLVSDGKFHDIKVRVRKPGLHVRARFGYTAPGGKVVASTPHRDMMASLGAGVDDPGLPLRAFVAPLAPASKGTRAAVTIELTYPKSEGDGLLLNDDLRVGILALTPDAKVKASLQRPVRFTGTWKPGAAGTLVLNEALDLPAEKLTLRVGVTSREFARTGTTHLAIEVPDFRKGALQLSPPVLGSAGDAVDAASGLDSIRTLVPFQPMTSRTFSSLQSIRVFARAYWADAPTVEATLTVAGASSLAPQPVTITSAAPPAAGRRSGVLDRTVALQGLPPGAYVLSVEARPAKGKAVRRDVPFEVR